MKRAAVGWACALLLGGCLPGANDAGTCGGYLGCSAGQTIGSDAGDASAAMVEGRPATGVDAVAKGPGCGKPKPTDQPMTVAGTPTGYKQYTVMGTGASLAGPQPTKVGPRTFWVRVPADYDPNHAYRVVYIGAGYNAFNDANLGGYPLYDAALGGTEEAIYVALDTPADMANMNGFDDRSGLASQEWEAFQLFQSVVDQTYCVDDDRIYVVGFETGADLANMWGCYFAGDGEMPASAPAAPRAFAPTYHVRGEGGVSGLEPDDDPPCNGPVAALWIHDAGNADVPINLALAARDRALRMNGCVASPTAPWHPELAGGGCVQYTACPADYPVVFCTTNGLGQSSQIGTAVAAFSLLFDDATGPP
jgi:poly(3-hydroxybutyrate) depolymerase